MKQLTHIIIGALLMLTTGAIVLPATMPVETEVYTVTVIEYVTEAPPEPTPETEPPYTVADIVMVSQVIHKEARGVPGTPPKAAVAWCILNRVGDPRFPNTIEGVVTAKNQFAYDPTAPWEPFYDLAEDVLIRWAREMNGETDVGRTLPADYFFFSGDGKINRFRQEYRDRVYWDWSLADPYAEVAE